MEQIEAIEGTVAHVGRFDWGQGVILRIGKHGRYIRIAADTELTVLLAKSLFQEVTIVGRRNGTGGFEAEKLGD